MKEVDTLRVVHSVPGRVRLRLGPETSEPNVDDFLQIDGVEEVSLNRVTRSVLMVYDDKVPLESVLSGIEEKMPPIEIVREELQARGATGEDLLGQAIVRTAVKLNGSVNAGTKGVASAASLFPLSLIAVGFVQIIMADEGVMPPGWALVWWGFNIFRGWHRRSEVSAKKVE